MTTTTLPTLYSWVTAEQAQAVREHGEIPATGPLGLVWMTTAPAGTLEGDPFCRGDVRVIVDDPRTVERWLDAQRRWELHEWASLELAGGATAAYWFVSERAVPATIG